MRIFLTWLLGAATASAWWAYAVFHSVDGKNLFFVPFILSVVSLATFCFIAFEQE